MFHFNEFLSSRKRPLVMGIVNATGDSFSEGGSSDARTALDRALALLDDGADLLDIGGESTRPGATDVDPEVEIARILPVIRGVRQAHPHAVISVDTRKSPVASAALECGVEIINDVAMLRYDPRLAAVAAAGGAALVLGHSRGTPQNMRDAAFCNYGDDLVAAVVDELREARDFALRSGMREEEIIFDPGLGFAKTSEQDWELLSRIDELHQLGAILVGMSRKSFLGNFLNQPEPPARLGGTVAAALHLAEREVEILRVHDVRQVRDALRVRERLLSF